MNFIITYTCYSEFGGILAKGRVRAKNKTNGVDAQGSLEKSLKKKHNLFGRLEVHSCIEEKITDKFFKDYDDTFSSIFKGFNI